MVTYILTKFGADWLIFVDARVLTRKLCLVLIGQYLVGCFGV